MSEVHDSWLEGIGVDVQGILGSVGDTASSAPPSQEAPPQSDFTSPVSSAVSAVGSNASTAPDAKGNSDGGTLSSIGSLASDAWQATKGVASAGYNAYQESTDFKPVASGEGSNVDWSGSKPISVTQALGAGVDWYEKTTEDNSKKMVASAEGIPVLEQLAQASAFVNDTTANVTGGVVRGVGDLAGGLANAVFHPIDAAAGIEGILEHDSPIPGLGSTLKAAHGAYDIATGNEKGEYGSSWGDLASNVLDPRKQQEDDAKFNSNLARGVLAPGTKDWSEAYDKLKENPADMLARAGTNVLPIVLGLGEAAAGDAAADVANAAPKGPIVGEPPPTPIVGPEDLPSGQKVINPGGGDPLRGMDISSVGEPGGGLAGMTDAEIDALGEGIEGSGQSSTYVEMPGQNPRSGAGLQDIPEMPPNANPNQIAQNVNHYLSDVAPPRIAELGEAPINPARAAGESVIPETAGTTAEAVPETAMETGGGDSVANASGEPIGSSNVEVRAHSTNPRFPDQGHTAQINTPSDRFGWNADRSIAVEGETGRYLLPDGTWVEMAQLQADIRAAAAAGNAAELARLRAIAQAAHWPTG